MEIYGLFGFTHGGARVLTVMCSEGAAAGLAKMPGDNDLLVVAATGRLTHYQEKRSGAIERLIATHGVLVLEKRQWDNRKASLGSRIW